VNHDRVFCGLTLQFLPASGCLLDAGMRGIIFACWCVTVTYLTAATPVQLFNGRDFTGWTFDVLDPAVKPDAVGSIADGVLVCKGRPPGVIRTTEEFGNYELTVEWRWATGGKAGNSGVLIHASKPRERFVWPKSVEVQLASGNAGDFWTIGESLTVADTPPDGHRYLRKADGAEKSPGEWNTAVIRCEGGNVSVKINGTLVNEATALSVTKGAICLQSENGEIHFRKVELTPLE
jgi:Domain of Unknown Function (DUF1080)